MAGDNDVQEEATRFGDSAPLRVPSGDSRALMLLVGSVEASVGSVVVDAGGGGSGLSSPLCKAAG